MSSLSAALLVSSMLVAGGSPASMPRVRSAAPAIRAALDDGIERSPSFRRLIDRLNASDVIVHVVYELRPRDGVAGRLAFVTDAGTIRYLRIFVSPGLSPDNLVAVLGHELEHALEVADRRWIASEAAMRAFYASIGIRRDLHGDVFDTEQAVDTGGRIRRELGAVR